MTARKKILISLAVIALIILGAFVIVHTRVVFWHNVYWNHEYPTVNDADYLGVYDLRFMLNGRDAGDIEKLGTELVNSSFENNGECSDEYEDVISRERFEEINPREYLYKYKEDIIDEDFDLIETDALVHGDKAIFFYGFSYEAFYNENGESAHSGRGYEGFPNRIYFSCVDGKWVVESVYDPG